MSRTRIVFYVLFLASVWGADVAGTFLLPDRDQVVVNGIALVVSFAMKSRCSERKAQAQAQRAIFEAHEERAALIKTIERLTGVTQTGPMAAVRRVA